MVERCIKGDYIGFTFGDVHSSELGLMRVSDGSRYNQDLLPPLQDKVAQVNGRDGAVYFGSQYNTRPIKVPVAFDNMTEESFNQLKKLLQDKKPKYLWFDETPYKQWLVKAANAQNFKWICFDESRNGKEKRIYKGEGTLEFSCFSPYAESRVTFLDEEINQVIFKANGKLNLGTTPYLEILTLSKNGMDKQLFSSPAIGDGISGNKEFVIKEADDLRIVNLDDQYYDVAKEYVKIMTKKGYITLSETSLIENSDTSEASPKYGFFGIRTSGTMYDGYRVGVVNDENLKILKEMKFDASGKSTTTFSIWQYGISFKTITDIYLYNKLIDKENRYHSYNFVAENTSNPYILIHEDKKGIQTLLQPIYDNNNTLIGIEESNLSIKILSLKGGIQDNTDLKGDINTLQNSYNYSEWVLSSNLRKQYDFYSNPLYNTYTSNNLMSVYNAGDIPTDCQIIISKTNLENYTLSNTNPIKFSISSSFDPNTEVGELILKSFSLLNGDEGIILDSKLKLIKGYKLKEDGSIQLTGTVYNKYKKEGDFFKIPICEDEEYYKITNSANIPFEVQYKHHYI